MLVYSGSITYIFLDESGDLGFDFRKKKTSHHFIVTILITGDKKGIEKLVKKIFHGFSKKEIRHHHGVLHTYFCEWKTGFGIGFGGGLRRRVFWEFVKVWCSNTNRRVFLFHKMTATAPKGTYETCTVTLRDETGNESTTLTFAERQTARRNTGEDPHC